MSEEEWEWTKAYNQNRYPALRYTYKYKHSVPLLGFKDGMLQ